MQFQVLDLFRFSRLFFSILLPPSQKGSIRVKEDEALFLAVVFAAISLVY